MDRQSVFSPVEKQGPELSVIVPCFNEKDTVGELLERLIEAVDSDVQIIVVDDASTDGTFELAQAFASSVDAIRQEENGGKGSAVRAGLELATGNYVVIQDADLEYDPEDLNTLLNTIHEHPGSAVYGSRYLSHGRRTTGPVANYYGVKVLNWLVRVLFRCKLTDSATCYKMLELADIQRMNLQSNRFELCPEITSKLCRMNVSIIEVPISYTPRKKCDGKKIRLRDFWMACLSYVSFRKWSPANRVPEREIPDAISARIDNHHPGNEKARIATQQPDRVVNQDSQSLEAASKPGY